MNWFQRIALKGHLPATLIHNRPVGIDATQTDNTEFVGLGYGKGNQIWRAILAINEQGYSFIW
nr:hypothetical protein [Candidatus Chloroploca mongolica]